MEFTLKNARQTNRIKANDNDTFTMDVEIQVKIVGTPDEEKYESFMPYFTIESNGKGGWKPIQYTYSKGLTGFEIEAGMITFAQDWITTNYPTIDE